MFDEDDFVPERDCNCDSYMEARRLERESYPQNTGITETSMAFGVPAGFIPSSIEYDVERARQALRSRQNSRMNIIWRDLDELAMGTPSYKGFAETKPKKEVKNMRLTPRKYNKLKEWSISNRILRYMVNMILNGGLERNFYKFYSIYDSSTQQYKVWNKKTGNIVCSVMLNTKRGHVIRYRKNSYYKDMLSSFNKKSVGGTNVVSVASENLSNGRSRTRYVLGEIEITEDKLLQTRQIMAGK